MLVRRSRSQDSGAWVTNRFVIFEVVEHPFGRCVISIKALGHLRTCHPAIVGKRGPVVVGGEKILKVHLELEDFHGVFVDAFRLALLITLIQVVFVVSVAVTVITQTHERL